jgi:hypothetical protein
MSRTLLALLALAACEKATPAKTADGSNAGPGSAAPASAAKPLIKQITTDSLAYSSASLPVMMAFDGDCKAQIDRLLTLEPLAKKIRAATTQLVALDPAGQADVKAELMKHKAPAMAELTSWLDDHHATMADADAKEQAIRKACGDDPAFGAAMDRVGVFKKRTAP